MEKTFGQFFSWVGRERKNQKGKEKVYPDVEMMWIKLVIGNDTYYIGGIYLPPSNSNINLDFKQALQQLEADCILYRKSGKVIVMGDFNARIGSLASIVQNGGDSYYFQRKVVDSDPSGESWGRGNQLVQAFNAANMVILNGLGGGGDVLLKVDQ
jgi:hypothetical protein